MLTVELIPILSDNYVFLITDSETSEAMVIDPGESEKTMDVLKTRKLKLKGILITHHHGDHIDGIKNLKKEFNAKVYAPVKNKLQIPVVDYWLHEDSQIDQGAFQIKVIELPGHTLGHLGYFFKKEMWLFSGDVVFGLGCGRLFEGSFEQMFQTLQKIKTLPEETQIFCAHEYTETNYRFCESLKSAVQTSLFVDPNSLQKYSQDLINKRSRGLPSVPLQLSTEMQTNPFLLAATVQQFTTVRKLRNVF